MLADTEGFQIHLSELNSVERNGGSSAPDENGITRKDARFVGRRPGSRDVETRVENLCSSLKYTDKLHIPVSLYISHITSNTPKSSRLLE